MFKMGCSMAKKILAIDKQSSNHDHGASGSSLDLGTSSSKKSKEKHQQQDSHFQGGGASSAAGPPNQAGAANKVKTNTEELGDFSKLEQDPRIPLNIRQIFKITKSWKAIARTMSKTGTAMFLNLFEQNQDLFYLFDRFQHLKGKELHESMELREHASTVMSTLDQSINSLSDYDNFVTYLHSIGKLHRKVPGFKRAHFWKIEQPFLKAVKQTLDERCNETIEEIYKIAIKLIIETIADGYGEDDLTASTNENKDSTSPSGSNNNNNTNTENSRDLSVGGSGNTKAGGNCGSTNTTNSQLRQHQAGQNRVLAVKEEELESNASFVNSLCSYKRKLFNQNRKQNKPANKRRKSETSSSGGIETNSNVRLMNLEEEEIENQIQLKQSDSKQETAINKWQRVESEKEKEKEMKQKEFEMRSNCSTPSSSSLNDLVARLNHPNTTDENNHRLHKKANDERLNETLLVLKELLLSLMAKKEDDKSSKEITLDDSKEVQLNDGEIEPPPTNECENSFNADSSNNNNLVESRDDTTTNGGGKQVELLNGIAGYRLERGEKNELSPKLAQSKCLAEEEFVKEEDNKGGNSCCKYRENFANDNNSERRYCNTTFIDHTLKVCEANCRFDHLDENEEKKEDIRGGVNSLERQVTSSSNIDQQQTIPSLARSNTKLNKVHQVKGEVFEDEDEDEDDHDGDEVDTSKRFVDDSLDKGLGSKVILASNCPSRIHWRDSEAAARTTKLSSEKKGKLSLEKRMKSKIACEVKTKQVSVKGTLKEKNDSENVNYTEVAKESEHDTASRALFSLFPTSSAALHSKASFNLTLSRCHSKNIKCYVNNDATNNNLRDAPPESTKTMTATTSFYNSSIWCSKLSMARRNIVRTLRLKTAKVTNNKQPPHNSLDNELPQRNIAANSRLPNPRSNLSSKPVTKTGKTTKTTTTTELESHVNENSTHPRWQTVMLVCSLAKRITTTKRPTLYNEQTLLSRQKQQQKLPLVNDQTRVELEDELEGSDVGLVEEMKYKQGSEKETKLKFHLFSDKRTTKSFLIPSLWSSSSLLSSSSQPCFGIEMGKINRKRQQMRKQTNSHQQRQQPDVTPETLERSLAEDNGEQSSKSKEQIKLTTIKTAPFKSDKSSSLLTTDLSDLSELIKMLMLTLTSKKQHHHLKQTEINNYIDNNNNNDSIN